MKLRYSYRVYPTAPQRRALARTFGCVRVAYNDGLQARRDAYRSGMPYISDAQLQKQVITAAKRTPERVWLSEVSSVALVQALGDLHAAYRAFFASLKGQRGGQKIGPPRFKKRAGQQTARYTRNGFRLRGNGRLYVAKVGDLKVAWSRDLPSEPSSVTIIKTPTGKYYASFVVDLDQDETLDPVEEETGIDLGLKDFAVLRGGKIIDNPRFFRKLERKLKKTQRELSRKQRGSANRAKARVKVAKVHEKIKHTRSDWVNKQVHQVIAENQGIYVEDLGVRGLSRGRAAKSVHDAAFGMFLARLESKAARAGRTFVAVDRYFPSTRLCSVCAALTGPQGLDGLKVREWMCGCGAVHDRDANAEVNIRREGKRLVAEGHTDT